jgi:hypothetical protein
VFHPFLCSKDNASDEDEESDAEEDGLPVRRSRRATKGKRFAYWKGERPIYEQGTMVGLVTAEPTPAKKKRLIKRSDQQAHAKRSKHGSSEDGEEEEGDDTGVEHKHKPLPPVVLPRNKHYIDREDSAELEVWDEATTSTTSTKVVCTAESLQPATSLPRTAHRPPGKNKVGTAAQSFNVPEVPGQQSGWLSGANLYYEITWILLLL